MFRTIKIMRLIKFFIFLNTTFGLSLPIFIQKRILKKGLNAYLFDSDCGSSFTGLCFPISLILNCNFKYIYEYIPIFNSTNAIKYGNAVDESFWWPKTKSFKLNPEAEFKVLRNVQPRINFINWCIENINNKDYYEGIYHSC